jgi:hypothetical protein
MGVGGQLHAPAALPPGKIPGTHCIGGWVGPRAGLDGCGKNNDKHFYFVEFFSYAKVQTDSWAQPASCSVGTGVPSPG